MRRWRCATGRAAFAFHVYEYNPDCGGTRFACPVPEDRCAGDLDCGEFGLCTRELDYSSNGEPVEAKFRSCSAGGCVIGRPFLIDGTERLAPSVARADWYSANAADFERIAVEEGQHAELAWRFVAWVLETRPALALQVREAFAQELAGVRPGQERASRDVAVSDCELARHGLLSPALRAALRERVLAGVVAPCAEALLAGAGWERPDASLPSRTAHPA